MKLFIPLKVLVALAFFVLLAVPAFAEFQAEFESGISESKPHTALGLGVALVPDYEGSDEYTGAPLLLFRYKLANGRFIDVLGNRAKFNMLASKEFQFGPVLQYRATRDDDVEDKQVKRMEEVDAAVEAGLFALVNVNNWSVGVQVVKDVSDAHDGTLVTVNGGYLYNVNTSLTLLPGLSATWASDDYMETYFSVDAENRGTSTLPSFNADSGMKDVTLALLADYHPWEHWKIVGGAGVKALVGDAKDSPVVDDRGDSLQMFVGALLAYQWR